jgi:Oxidoreductase family, NAD-binding Rossmann fold
MTIWIVGAGEIAGCYLQVLRHLGKEAVVIGRGVASARRFSEVHGSKVIDGGIATFLAATPRRPDAAIVAVSADELAAAAHALIAYGVPHVLVEKPAGRSIPEVADVASTAERQGSTVYVAYNRRFLASVTKAREMIEHDGGLTSFAFEFTEWPHRVLSMPHPPGVLDAWFFMNSTHVVDLAFDLGGWPVRLDAFCAHELPWHQYGSFAGAGLSTRNIPFAYHADWQSSGRWRIDLCTRARRLVLAPLEKLFQIRVASVELEPVALDDVVDQTFKPGFLRQVEAFLQAQGGVSTHLPTIGDHLGHCAWYAKMCPSDALRRAASA